LLLPDVDGGFSFYAMARRLPDSALWAKLADLFSHVQWSGASVWDLIMPAFVFIVGVAMPLSAETRAARGESRARMLGHVLLRSLMLVLLALTLRVNAYTNIALLWPLSLLTLGLPLSTWLERLLAPRPPSLARAVTRAWWAIVLVASAVWVAAHIYDFGQWRFADILSQLALASPFAYLLVGKRRAVQLATALGILVAYWALFALYPLPAPDFDLASVGVAPGDEVFTGFFAHWNKNTNFAAAFDVWFLNLLPRPEPFLFDPKGIQTLDFVPTVATMIFGVMAGELVRRPLPEARIRNVLVFGGAAGVVAGLAAAVWVCPSIKSLWTPSYALWTAGLATLVLGLIYHLCDVRNRRSWAFPLIVFGTNSLLLYVLASRFRFYFLRIPERVTGIDWLAGTYEPVLESALFAAMLFCIAFALYKVRVHVKL
jgi:predicted acyltransferase